MSQVIIYSADHCPYCQRAKQLLSQKGVSYEEIRVDNDPSLREEMVEKSGRMTVPQIFINGQPIGGYDDLYALHSQGKLDELLNQ